MKKHLIYTSLIILVQTTYSILPTISCAQNIACGGQHSLYICSDSTVNAWGWNLFGQLGDDGGNSNVAVDVNLLNGVTDVSAGVNHSVVLKDDGTVWAWGYNQTGELGNGTNIGSNIPAQVVDITDITAISSMYHTLALKNDGTVWAWGYNIYGELGNGTAGGSSNVPVQVSGLTGITNIACGYYHSLAIKDDNTAWAWGYNGSGELGNGSDILFSNVPVQVTGLTDIIALAGGNSFSLAIINDSTVWAWGSNNEGELGNGTNTISKIPVQVSGLSGIIAITAGTYHALALKNDGTVWTWGFNMYGQLGNGTFTDSNIPVQVNGLTGIVAIAGGYAHSLAMRNDGTCWAWGYNSYGQLGNGADTNSNVPVQVADLCQNTTGVREIENPLNISVFPNPFENEFTIAGTKEKGLAIILDVNGKETFRQKAHDGETIINNGNLLPGIYFLNYKEANTSSIIKLVKF
jgi:alpha-tubulin suppressor-like RCC1 family protein